MTRASAALALAKTVRSDVWNNVITGLGVSGRDKRLGADFDTNVVSWGDAEALHRSDDMAARAAELPAKEMTREWLDVQVADNEQQGKDLTADLDRVEARQKFLEAMIWARVFGGSGILIGARDGASDPMEPLREDVIQSVDWLTVFDLRELIAVQWYSDPSKPKYGEPEIYRLTPLTMDANNVRVIEYSENKRGIFGTKELGVGAMYVHESRIIRFEGTRVSRRIMRAQGGWPDSIYNRLLDEIRDFQAAFDSAAVLVQDFAQAVAKIEGLHEILASNQKDVFEGRMAALNQGRSVTGLYLIDSKEEFERQATPIDGLVELLEQFALRIASAIEVPVSLLMGQAPAGLNATGDTDVRWFYSRVKSLQNSDLTPKVRRLVTLLALAKRGPTKGVLPKSFDIVHRPLWSLSDLEESQRRLAIAQADHIYMTDGAVTPEEVGVTRFAGSHFNGDKVQLVEVDPEKRALAAAEQMEAQQEHALALKTATAQPEPPAGDDQQAA